MRAKVNLLTLEPTGALPHGNQIRGVELASLWLDLQEEHADLLFQQIPDALMPEFRRSLKAQPWGFRFEAIAFTEVL